MASKSKKSSTPVQQQPTVQSNRPSSPLSPTRHSRMQEKADLQNLNDRLATYIDKVRYLEGENSRLTREVQKTHETVTRQVTDIKLMYDNELTEARKLLDETFREKAKLEIDAKRLWDENEELKSDLSKKNKDLVLAENSARIWETRANELQLKYNQANTDAKKAINDMKDLEKERDRLRKQAEDLRKQLEEESLARVDVENHNQTLREELSFKDQVYQKELTDTRVRRQVEISEIDGRLAEKYEAKLQETLQDLRDQYESQMASNRHEIEVLYENKIKNLQLATNRHSSAASNALDELRQVRTRIDTLTSRIGELENQNSGLQSRCRDLEKLLENERMRHADDIALMENDLARLREEMANQLQEYQDLMDIKVSLDLEIAAYRKLLESEEARLNITPHGSPDLSSATSTTTTQVRGGSQRRTPVRVGAKRKRTLLEESHEQSMSDYSVNSTSKGDIEIVDVDREGKYIKIHNKSNNQDISLGGWTILLKAGDHETLYKFHRSIKIEQNGYVTIWSSDQNKEHEPPTNVVMKGQKWLVADNMVTTLFNNNGDEVAVSERVKRQLSSSLLRHREMGGGFLASEELHHQFGDPQGEEKCRIM